jgi:hypothetical protein
MDVVGEKATVSAAVPVKEGIRTATVVQKTSDAFWIAWSVRDAFVVWHDKRRRNRRVSFFGDDDESIIGELERRVLGGCECAEHKIHYEQHRTLAVSAQLTVHMGVSGDNPQHREGVAELTCVYRHYFGRATQENDDDDDDAKHVLNCPFAGETAFARLSEHRAMFTTPFVLRTDIARAVDAFRTETLPRLISQWKDAHATLLVCAICHTIEPTRIAIDSTLCASCFLCQHTTNMLLSPPAARTCCVCADEAQPMTAFDSVSLCAHEQHCIHIACATQLHSRICPLCRG